MTRSLDERTVNAIEASDTDELIRIIDGVCVARDWDRLDTIRRHCMAAVERGKQLWAVDEHARYRLALEAPGDRAAAAVIEGPTRFALGPLSEVAASRHTWDELEEALDHEPERAIVAHERIVRGENLGSATFDRAVLEIPDQLMDWEPQYAIADYSGDRAEFPTPATPVFTSIPRTEIKPGPPSAETEVLSGLVLHWVETSSGRVHTAGVDGAAVDAISALGVRRAAATRIRPDEAMAWMAWAAASGAAHARRRGAAMGRFEAWWAATVLAGLDWPPEPDTLGEAIEELGWWVWTDGSSEGWNLRLAIEDRHNGLAWAVSAVDIDITKPVLQT